MRFEQADERPVDERLRPGVYVVELAVTDLGGNVSLRRFGLVVGRSRIVLADR